MTKYLSTFLVACVGLAACGEPIPPLAPNDDAPLVNHTVGMQGINTVDLLAGQTTDVGDVTITDDGTDLTVTITMEAGWCLTEVHLAAADAEEWIPQNNKGNPQIGQFGKWSDGDSWTGFAAEFECSTGDSWSFPLRPDMNGDDAIVVAVHAVVVSTETACFDASGGSPVNTGGLVFGTLQGDPTALYRIDLNTNTASQIAVPTAGAPANPNSPNGLAYDPDNARLYFSVTASQGDLNPSQIWFYDFGTGTFTNAGDAEAPTTVAGAGWYNGKYWYIENQTDDLRAISFYPDGTIASEALIYEDLTGSARIYRFGDIVITDAGILYASTLGSGGSNPEFFQVDLSDGTYTTLCTSPTDCSNWTGDPTGKQLALDSDGTLYAHSTSSGEFWSVDVPNRTMTSLGSVDNFTDLSFGPRPCETETAWGEGTRFVEQGSWATYIDYQPSACPAVNSNSANVTILSGTDLDALSVAKDETTSEETIFMFAEGVQDVTDLPLDVPATTVTGQFCSYYVHFDLGSGSSLSGGKRLTENATFARDIAGLIVAGSSNPSGGLFAGQNTLCDTNDDLGLEDVEYEKPAGYCGASEDQRGLEIGTVLSPPAGNNDGVEIDPDNRVRFSLRVVPDYHDAFRVVLPASGIIIPPSP